MVPRPQLEDSTCTHVAGGLGNTLMRWILTGILMLLGIGMGTVAKAELLAAGAAYGGPTQYTGVCYLFNAGTTSVSVSSISIYDEVGNAYISLSNNCSSLAPKRACRTVSRIFEGIAYSCRALVSLKANIRGELEFRTSTGVVLTNLEMR
jgi:hypothetical protein